VAFLFITKKQITLKEEKVMQEVIRRILGGAKSSMLQQITKGDYYLKADDNGVYVYGTNDVLICKIDSDEYLSRHAMV
jgi:hypothetical protein